MGIEFTDSLTLARHAGTYHKEVVHAIEKVIASVSERFAKDNFIPSRHLDDRGRLQKSYEMTCRAYTLMMMKLDTKKANTYKKEVIRITHEWHDGFDGSVNSVVSLLIDNKEVW
jgi:Rha family phage regulatory protein